jgi:hypothetical protein
MANYVARFDSFFAITDHHLAAAIWPFIENVSIPRLCNAKPDALSPPPPSALNLVGVPSLASILRQRRSQQVPDGYREERVRRHLELDCDLRASVR